MTDNESFLIDEIVVTVIRSTRRKRLSIEVGHQGVIARAPMRMRLKGIVEFVSSKQAWITQHLSNLPSPMADLQMRDGAELLLFGQNYSLSILSSQRGQVSQGYDQIMVPVVKSHLALETTVHNKLIKWYKRMAEARLIARVQSYAQDMDIPASKSLSVQVKDYKRRWGSCDQKGALSFNWRIVQAPPEVLDYVVVHELAHCHEFNHSKRFWNIVAEQMPDWKERENWLQIQGGLLYRL